jgi:hypothetical protein
MRRTADAPGITESDAALLETPSGRASDSGASHPGTLLDEELRSENAPAWSLTETAGAQHPEADTGETADGFDDVEEGVRHRAEDIPSSEGNEDRPAELPVFESGLTEPKV